jgi:hypothetical protein
MNTMQWSEQTEFRRNYALRKWKHIIQTDPQATTFGHLLHEADLDMGENVQLTNTLQDMFAHKAKSVMSIRAGQLQKYSLWCKRHWYSCVPIAE